ncbi:cellulose-binding domain-containing protein, partial [Micromonospora zhanjiangensis]
MHRIRRLWLAGTLAALLSTTGAAFAATSAQAASGCKVTYTISSSWSGGFGANVDITNLGDPVNGWRLTWTYGAGQTIQQLWNGSYTQSGANVTVTNAAYNGAIGTNASVSFGFNGSWTGSNPVPTNFALNGVACGDTPPPTTAPPTTTPPPTTAPPTTTPP